MSTWSSPRTAQTTQIIRQSAHGSTVAAEHGCTVATLDRDFARFPSVPHKLLAR